MRLRERKPSLGVVIVTYKTPQLCRDCVASVLADMPSDLEAKVVVVDNASGDETVGLLRKEFPTVLVVANTENLGPARAYNQGIRLVLACEYIMLLNSDIKLLPGTIPAMLTYLERHPELSGVIGGLYFPDGRKQFMKVRIRPHLTPLPWDRPFPVDFVSTCFMMARSSTFTDVGLFDENYYFFNEDLDWSERASRLGHKFMYLPDARVIHYGSQGLKQNYGPIIKELYKSNVYYFYKFYGPVVAHLLWPGMALDIWWRKRRLRKMMAGLTDPQEIEEKKKSLSYLDLAYQELRRYLREGPFPERWRP